MIDFFNDLNKRYGSKHGKIGSAPHTQINQFPKKTEFADDLHDYVMTFEGFTNGESHIGDDGLRVFFIKNDKNQGFEQKF